jgi:hypothetical protein
MRAKVVSGVLVACGMLGAVAIAAPSTTTELASRARHGGGDGHDNGQQGNEYNHSCTANDHSVIGNVCVIVDDLPILGRILTS